MTMDYGSWLNADQAGATLKGTVTIIIDNGVPTVTGNYTLAVKDRTHNANNSFKLVPTVSINN